MRTSEHCVLLLAATICYLDGRAAEAIALAAQQNKQSSYSSPGVFQCRGRSVTSACIFTRTSASCRLTPLLYAIISG